MNMDINMDTNKIRKVLTIAGSDCSGGAGIQADLKTISAHNMYGMSVITSITAQNTMGVYGIYDVPVEGVKRQIEAVFEDIRPEAVKIGMVSNVDIINIISDMLNKYKADNVVLDPVMVSTSGSKLLSDNTSGNTTVEMLVKKLMPLSTIITPNVSEAEVLSHQTITSEKDMEVAAQKIYENIGVDVLIKGGHLKHNADDLLYSKGSAKWFKAERINNNNTHGTGCTLSSAIACNLAIGKDIVTSVRDAKEYVYKAINAGLNLGHGDGPLWHRVT